MLIHVALLAPAARVLTMDDLANRINEHNELLNKWRAQYQANLANDNNEFTVDGPSDWLRYSQQHPRILFLLKESHGDGWHPSLKSKMDKTRFSENVTLWKYAINLLYQDRADNTTFPSIESIHDGDHSDLAFVEVKKLNEAKPTSDNQEIRASAKKDKEFLKAQIDLIDPHIVLCAYTINAYDAIYDEKYAPYVELSSMGTCKCWQLNNRLVIDFFHPSNWSKPPQELYNSLCSLIMKGNVFQQFSWSKWS
jgi:hypothetical protein